MNETSILCILLAVSLFRCTCTDMQGSEKWDYSTMPSLLGPGTYLAWIITGIDAFWESWIEIVPWRAGGNERLPEIQQHARDNREEEEQGNTMLQTIAFVAYAAVALCYLGVVVVKKMPSLEYAAQADAFFLIANAVFVVAYPYINKVFPFENRKRRIILSAYMVIIKLILAMDMWNAHFNNFDTLPLRIKRVLTIGLLTAQFMFLVLVNPRICRWSLSLQYTPAIPQEVSFLVGMVLSKAKEDTKEFPRWSLKYCLRAPIPRTQYRLSELDQAFALGLAATSFL